MKLQETKTVAEMVTEKIKTACIFYADWFKEKYLEPHFKIEEQVFFPLLGTNVRVKRAFANHRRIIKLLTCSCEHIMVLNLLEEELGTHVRFEERILYWEIKKIATPQELAEIEKHHQGLCFNDAEWEDQFWLE
ncbi:hemerythrin domain-containing protein [Salinimicrobium sediminilitoris]|uniref:hemerythrin domain-containing protein n=1 Tax=Salinimicrobium sediminilitoris TaxID=2876715 RepID=UPI001E2C12F3|nr:hemerythrin domain-containing protein [Salinimicrobium sediminilitoris]MCC8358327.1 hemerythrin domain-containing protein [Salinimicrobium sediminilitoris]